MKITRDDPNPVQRIIEMFADFQINQRERIEICTELESTKKVLEETKNALKLANEKIVEQATKLRDFERKLTAIETEKAMALNNSEQIQATIIEKDKKYADIALKYEKLSLMQKKLMTIPPPPPFPPPLPPLSRASSSAPMSIITNCTAIACTVNPSIADVTAMRIRCPAVQQQQQQLLGLAPPQIIQPYTYFVVPPPFEQTVGAFVVCQQTPYEFQFQLNQQQLLQVSQSSI